MSDILDRLVRFSPHKQCMSSDLEVEAAAEITRLREENARLRVENKHIITEKIVLEWYPELDKQTGCYDYRIAMHSMGHAFDVFRQLVLNPALEENARMREALDRIEDDILFHIENYRQPNNEALMMWRRDACDALGKTGLRAAIREEVEASDSETPMRRSFSGGDDE